MKVFGLVFAFAVSSWASFTFFKGSLTGASPLYSLGWLQRSLHFAAGILFAALALFAAVKLYTCLPVTSATSLTRAGVAVVNPQMFTGFPPSVYMQFFQACSPEQPCTRTDDFRVDSLPKGCCRLLLANGDGKGNDEVQTYEVFLNGERVVARGHSPSAQAAVKLRPTNTLKVILSGAPHSKVFVLFAYDSGQSK